MDVAKCTLSSVEEVLTVEESYDALMGWLLGHGALSVTMLTLTRAGNTKPRQRPCGVSGGVEVDVRDIVRETLNIK
jgi:hypothetical protein